MSERALDAATLWLASVSASEMPTAASEPIVSPLAVVIASAVWSAVTPIEPETVRSGALAAVPIVASVVMFEIATATAGVTAAPSLASAPLLASVVILCEPVAVSVRSVASLIVTPLAIAARVVSLTIAIETEAPMPTLSPVMLSFGSACVVDTAVEVAVSVMSSAAALLLLASASIVGGPRAGSAPAPISDARAGVDDVQRERDSDGDVAAGAGRRGGVEAVAARAGRRRGAEPVGVDDRPVVDRRAVGQVDEVDRHAGTDARAAGVDRGARGGRCSLALGGRAQRQQAAGVDRRARQAGRIADAGVTVDVRDVDDDRRRDRDRAVAVLGARVLRTAVGTGGAVVRCLAVARVALVRALRVGVVAVVGGAGRRCLGRAVDDRRAVGGEGSRRRPWSDLARASRSSCASRS